MTQEYISNNKIKENKYKILRMSLILGSDNNRAETLNNFEEASRDVDAMNDEIYLNDLEEKFYDTLKIEEEEKKLADLVDYIGGRVEQRISLLNDFANVTGYDLTNLPPIKYYDKLDDYKERLKYIREYLNNTRKIEKLNTEIEESVAKLEEAYKTKKESEDFNARSEEIIQSKFTNIIRTITSLKDVTENNVDSKLSDITYSVNDSKKSLDIFNKAYNTLKDSGISSDESFEYKSYIDNAVEIYYSNKEQEYLLKIYKLLISKEVEYTNIILKRDEINNILYERLNLRKELEINANDVLSPLYDILERQYDDISRQKITIESIEYLTELIETKKEEKASLELDNQKVEILSLLREFCIIDPYTDSTSEIVQNEIDDIKLTDENTEINTEEEKEESASSNEEIIMPQMPLIIDEEVKDNQVIKTDKASNIDLNLIQSKASKVMKRVGEMLGIKIEDTKIVSVTNETENILPVENKIPEEINTVKEENNNDNQIEEENPLFNNIIPNINDTEINKEEPVDPEDKEIPDLDETPNFWFPSETPDALNALPDLEISSDNFFGGDNAMPDLNFPDLKIDFGQGNKEEK